MWSRRPRGPACALALAPALLAGCERTAAPPPRPEAIAAPADGEVAPWVRGRVEAAAGRDVVVYVGAAWCEPCRHFKDALHRGGLDAALPRLTVLEYDLDRDGARLEAAGYTSQMIPLFMRPGPDGRGSPRFIEGSIKGEGAVAEIVPRLRALLAR